MIATRFRTHGEEILDTEGLSERGHAILADLDRWNRLAGWYRFHTRQVALHWVALGRPTPFKVVDVGTGPGGLLAAIADWADAEDIPVELTGVDLNPGYAAMARARLGDRAVILEADATCLPAGDGAFHLGTSTLMMHHLPADVRHAMVAEMGRVTRSVYLFDLEITLHGMVGFALISRLLGFRAETRHDGLLSVRRASTLSEFQALVAPLPVRARRVFPSALCTVPR